MHDRTPRLPPHSIRFFPTYSLRGLMLAVLVCSVVLATVTRRAHKQRLAVAGVREAGGEVWYDFQRGPNGEWIKSPTLPGPDWLRNWLGIDYVARVRGVTGRGELGVFNDIALSPTQFDAMATIEGLKFIDLSYRGVTAENLNRLQNFASLDSIERLDLAYALIEGDGLAILLSMPNLRSLDLEGCRIGDAGFEHVGRCRSLVELNLKRTDATDARLERLASLAKLESLDLTEVNVTDAGLSALQGMQRLQRLRLEDTFVDGSGLEHVSNSLMELGVANTLLDDAGLIRIARFPRIERLDIHDNRISVRGLAALLALPRLRDLMPYSSREDSFRRSSGVQQLRDFIADPANEALIPVRGEKLAHRLRPLLAKADILIPDTGSKNWLDRLDRIEAALNGPSHEAEINAVLKDRPSGLGWYTGSWVGKDQQSYWHSYWDDVFRDYGCTPLAARPRIDKLFQRAVRGSTRPAYVYIRWAFSEPRTIANDEARFAVESLAVELPHKDVLHQVVAYGDHQLSCLAAAVAVEPSITTWRALTEAAPSSLHLEIVKAWLASDPDNAATWYAAAFSFGGRLQRGDSAQVLASIRTGNECPELRLGQPVQIGDPWLKFAEALASAHPYHELEIRGNHQRRRPLNLSFWNGRWICGGLLSCCERLHADLRVAKTRELPPEIYEMFRRFIVASPRQLDAVHAGCESLIELLKGEEKRNTSQPHLRERLRERRQLVEGLWKAVDRLWQRTHRQGGPTPEVQAWQRGLVHCTDEAAKELMSAIDAWDAADRRLMASPVEQSD